MLTYWRLLLGFLLIFKASRASELPNECTSASVQFNEERQRALEFRNQKKEVLNLLLSKFNALIEPVRVASIPWNFVICTGWPEAVKSKLNRDWSLEDLEILRQKMSEIQIKPVYSDCLPNDMTAAYSMLGGTYSNVFYDSFILRYQILSLLGKGGNAFVMKARRLSDSAEVAIKFVNHRLLDASFLVRHQKFQFLPIEVDIFLKVSHPGIIGYYSYSRDSIYSYIVLDLFGTQWTPLNDGEECGDEDDDDDDENISHDLNSCIWAHRSIHEEVCHFIFTQIYDAVLYLHRNGIFHGDLKCENVLIDADYRIKLIDFGLARYIPRGESGEDALLSEISGTKIYMAPELIRKEEYLASEVETWALGLILYKLQYRENPFNITEEILGKDLKFPAFDPTGIHDLTQKLLCKDRNERIKLSEVANHPWIKAFQDQSSARMKSLEECKKRKASN